LVPQPMDQPSLHLPALVVAPGFACYGRPRQRPVFFCGPDVASLNAN
jgi:hypothetical protein